jgi:tubulin alpha
MTPEMVVNRINDAMKIANDVLQRHAAAVICTVPSLCAFCQPHLALKSLKSSVFSISSYLFCLAFAPPTMSLKNAVITGANRGLGLELCRQLSLDERYQTIYALCRKTSPELTELASKNQKIGIVDGVNVTDNGVGIKLGSFFRTDTTDEPIIPIHLLIHNAGAYGPPKDCVDAQAMYASQSLETITRERMRFALELNTLAPLFVTQALLPNLQATGKVIIISSLMGSIRDNTAGAHYGYRTAKAAANMVGKTLAMDLKSPERQIAVGMIHPGFVATGFDGGKKRREGQRDVDVCVKGVLQAVDQVTLETTGCFLHGGYGEGVRPLDW